MLDRFTDYPDYTLYVAERGGTIVGSFALLMMHNLGHLGAPSAIVEDVVVAPELQGHGIGKAMMRFVLDRLPRQGLLQAGAVLQREARARACVLRALGFERVLSFRELHPG